MELLATAHLQRGQGRTAEPATEEASREGAKGGHQKGSHQLVGNGESRVVELGLQGQMTEENLKANKASRCGGPPKPSSSR